MSETSSRSNQISDRAYRYGNDAKRPRSVFAREKLMAHESLCCSWTRLKRHRGGCDHVKMEPLKPVHLCVLANLLLVWESVRFNTTPCDILETNSDQMTIDFHFVFARRKGSLSPSDVSDSGSVTNSALSHSDIPSLIIFPEQHNTEAFISNAMNEQRIIRTTGPSRYEIFICCFDRIINLLRFRK